MSLRTAGRRATLLVLVAGLAGLPAAAQYEDEQTDDHAERDQRYLERRRQPAAQPTERPAADAREQERYFAFVDELIHDRNYRVHESEHYRVQSDDPRLDPVAAAALLENFRRFFDGHWGDRLDLTDYAGPSRVYLFWSYHKYNQLLGADFSRSLLRPKGHYGSAFDALTLHTDSETDGDVPDTLIHEAAHQLVDQRIEWTRGSAPTWLAEGLGCYFGYMQYDADGTFHPGRVGGKQVALFRGEKPRKPTASAGRLDAFKRGMKQVRGDSYYGRLLWMDEPAEFYGENTSFNYAAAWMLVHWLLEGDGGAHADTFFDWIAREAAGDARPQDLVEALGSSVEAIDAAVTDHAKRIRVR